MEPTKTIDDYTMQLEELGYTREQIKETLEAFQVDAELDAEDQLMDAISDNEELYNKILSMRAEATKEELQEVLSGAAEQAWGMSFAEKVDSLVLESFRIAFDAG